MYIVSLYSGAKDVRCPILLDREFRVPSVLIREQFVEESPQPVDPKEEPEDLRPPPEKEH